MNERLKIVVLQTGTNQWYYELWTIGGKKPGFKGTDYKWYDTAEEAFTNAVQHNKEIEGIPPEKKSRLTREELNDISQKVLAEILSKLNILKNI